MVSLPALAFCLVAGAHAQASRPPVVGGGGGGSFEARCPAGQVLGGLELRVGDDVDGIRPLCRSISSTIEQVEDWPRRGPTVADTYHEVVRYPLSAATASGDWYGGSQSAATRTISCDEPLRYIANETPAAHEDRVRRSGLPGGITVGVVSGIYVEAEGVDNVIVNLITLRCGGLSGAGSGSFDERDFWSHEYKNSVLTFSGREYDASHTGGFESQATKTKGASRCADNTVAVGIHGRAGKWLDAVGLLCDRATLPPAPIRSVGRVKVPPVKGNDFNGDGSADILWHNASTGELQIWFLNGASRVGRQPLLDYGSLCAERGSAGCAGSNDDATRARASLRLIAPWDVVASRDFDRNGMSDLLLYNRSTGELRVYYVQGHKGLGGYPLYTEHGDVARIGPPWLVVAAADFNWDSFTDLAWHNDATGETQIWFMRTTQVTKRATVLGEDGRPALIGPPWSIVGASDFNKDGNADLLWHNASTGESQIWHLRDHVLRGRATVLGENGTPILVGLPWRIVGTTDFDLNGSADILWHDEATGDTQMWLMTGHRLIGRANVDAARDGGNARVGLPWRIINH
jgi:hypothetical protein